MLAAVGGSHLTSVTDEDVELGHRPPNVVDEPSVRTGRYVVEFTYTAHRAVVHLSPMSLASPRGSLMVTGFPVIFVVSTPSTRTCPVTVAAPQRSVAPMKAGQWLVTVEGPPSSSAAVVEHARAAVGTSRDRLNSRLLYVT